MMSMTQILVTIFCGYAFAGIVEKAGCLEVLLTTISKGIHSVGSLICITVICCIALVFAAGVASIVIIMVGVLMKDLFEKYQVSRSVLSRTLEDSSTMVLPLIPWEHQVFTIRINFMSLLENFSYGQYHVIYAQL